ncbi:UNVERIFIED_CONTAM: hypothetical protein GTU68_028377 [Idotea baltica]|nr:hypothetical protein [Idotea baltica]
MTYKASIKTESMAGLAGGVTSFMEMPNTKPPALTQNLLEDKYEIGAADANQIKCNPAIKETSHKGKLMQGLLDDVLDIIATDHAPHTWDEKCRNYLEAPSGLPLLQHSLNLMLDFHKEGKISLEKIVEKMCHAPAECFRVKDRGYLREGYWADLALVDLEQEWMVEKNNVLYKCGWSPLEGKTFKGKVDKTILNGQLVYDQHQGFLKRNAMRMKFRS